jgi:hypothetical protein
MDANIGLERFRFLAACSQNLGESGDNLILKLPATKKMPSSTIIAQIQQFHKFGDQ